MDVRSSELTCPMCGHRFLAQERTVCGACPLAKGCTFVCCPACGYQILETERSPVGRWLTAAFRGRARSSDEDSHSLADVPTGWSARIADMASASPSRRLQLRAFGLEAKRWVRVIQHQPVTVVAIDGTELALETELARRVRVDSLRQ